MGELSTADALSALIRNVVAETLAQLHAGPAQANGTLAMTEAAAAARLGVARHVLRDARLRGEIAGKLIGKRIYYSEAALAAFINGRPAANDMRRRG